MQNVDPPRLGGRVQMAPVEVDPALCCGVRNKLVARAEHPVGPASDRWQGVARPELMRRLLTVPLRALLLFPLL
eukprot:scaffold54442_cov24-Tisochrysis_lutea.AAC.1